VTADKDGNYRVGLPPAIMSWMPKVAHPDMCARHPSDSALSRTRQSTLTSNWTPAIR